MPVDPTVGVADPVYEGSSQGFIVEHRDPLPPLGQRSAPPTSARTRLVYYGPEHRVFRRPERQRVTIELHYPEAMPGHRPYYYELDHVPRERNAPYGIDKLRLYVDRDVRIIVPENRGRDPREPIATARNASANARGPWGKWFDIRLPDLTRPIVSGAPQPGDSLHLLIHRNQSLATIPQSNGDAVAAFVPITRVGPERIVSDPMSRADGQVVLHIEERGVCEYRVLPDGGAELVFRSQRLTRSASLMGVGREPGMSQKLGVLRLRYWNPEYPAKYHVDFRVDATNLFVVVTLDSRNTYATFGVIGSSETVISDVMGQGLLERTRDAFEGRGVALRFLDSSAVPRIRQRQRAASVPWYEYVVRRPDRVRLYPVRDVEADAVYDILTTVVGFVPIVGDAFDIGQFAYALITGEDFAGREQSATDMMLLGLALLPYVPRLRLAASVSERISAARRLAERFPGGLQALRRLVNLRLSARRIPSAEAARVAVASGMLRDLDLLLPPAS